MLVEMAVVAIRTSKLTKDYGAARGLFELDLQVSPQEVFGYLGPNGSGKTTTIRLLIDRKSTRLNSSHEWISYAVFCLKKKKKNAQQTHQSNREMQQKDHVPK